MARRRQKRRTMQKSSLSSLSMKLRMPRPKPLPRLFNAKSAPLWFLGAFLIFALAHNLVSGLSKFDEPLFFFLALFSGFAFIVSLVYLIILLIIDMFKK